MILTDLVKRYALSSTVTFLSTFFLFMGSNIGALGSPSQLSYAAILGLLTVAGRAAFKAVIEAIVGGHADLPSLTPVAPVVNPQVAAANAALPVPAQQ